MGIGPSQGMGMPTPMSTPMSTPMQQAPRQPPLGYGFSPEQSQTPVPNLQSLAANTVANNQQYLGGGQGGGQTAAGAPQAGNSSEDLPAWILDFLNSQMRGGPGAGIWPATASAGGGRPSSGMGAPNGSAAS